MEDKEKHSLMLLTHIMDIKENISGIREHLKALNGSVARHEKQLTTTCSIKHDKIDSHLGLCKADLDKKIKEVNEEVKISTAFRNKLIGAIIASNAFITTIIVIGVNYLFKP